MPIAEDDDRGGFGVLRGFQRPAAYAATKVDQSYAVSSNRLLCDVVAFRLRALVFVEVVVEVEDMAR